MDRSVLQNLDALFITNPTNILYITGFVGVATDEREAYILLTKNKLYLFTGPLYFESSKNTKCPMPNVKLEIIQISREKTIWKRLKEIFNTHALGRIIRLGFEEDNLKVSEYNEILKHLPAGKAGAQNDRLRITLVPIKNKIEKMRMIKREDEIENIREAAELTDKCFEYILSKLRPGVTESEIAWEIESHVHVGGAHELAFSPIVAFGRHSSQPHYQASNDSRLAVNDLVLLDFGARVNGYCADMTRVVFVGKPKNEWVRAYKAVLQAQESAINYLRAQACLPARQGRALSSKRFGKKADQLARTIIKEAGYPVYPHSLGHGVGLAIHEAPRLTIKRDATLKPGMIVTVEPGIYIEGQYGIRIEDLLLIKENDIEILSLSPKSLIIL